MKNTIIATILATMISASGAFAAVSKINGGGEKYEDDSKIKKGSNKPGSTSPKKGGTPRAQDVNYKVK